jgi:hypothetical protein
VLPPGITTAIATDIKERQNNIVSFRNSIKGRLRLGKPIRVAVKTQRPFKSGIESLFKKGAVGHGVFGIAFHLDDPSLLNGGQQTAVAPANLAHCWFLRSHRTYFLSIWNYSL